MLKTILYFSLLTYNNNFLRKGSSIPSCPCQGTFDFPRETTFSPSALLLSKALDIKVAFLLSEPKCR